MAPPSPPPLPPPGLQPCPHNVHRTSLALLWHSLPPHRLLPPSTFLFTTYPSATTRTPLPPPPHTSLPHLPSPTPLQPAASVQPLLHSYPALKTCVHLPFSPLPPFALLDVTAPSQPDTAHAACTHTPPASLVSPNTHRSLTACRRLSAASSSSSSGCTAACLPAACLPGAALPACPSCCSSSSSP